MATSGKPNVAQQLADTKCEGKSPLPVEIYIIVSFSERLCAFVKVVILAGGFGTRISEETHLRPKPMIEIGEKPLLWHIMKTYSRFGFNEFVVCLGFKGYIIKEYFYNYFLHNCDVTFDVRTQGMEIHQNATGAPSSSLHPALLATRGNIYVTLPAALLYRWR